MDKTIVITGGSDGIGAAAARQLHSTGHHVVIVGRSAEKTSALGRSLGIDFYVADFARLDDVRQLANDLDTAYPHIDVLANNAGGVFGDGVKTSDGFEKTFQVNYLAPFLLTALLINKLTRSHATVIQTSARHGGPLRHLDLEDLNNERSRIFHAERAYSATKLENVLFTRELHRRYHRDGLSAAAFDPGVVATNFASNTTSLLFRFLARSALSRSLLLTTPDQGASQLVWLATSSPGIDWESGAFYAKRKIDRRLNKLAQDDDLAKRLWHRSGKLVASLRR